MSFLSPALFLILIPLVGLPLLLHLLNKGFPSYFSFPSIELIRATMARRSKPHRWRHWILLLLRSLFLLLLLLAFLRPVLKRFGSNPADQTGRQVLVVLDHSVSMEDKGDGPTSRARAIHEADKLLDSLRPEDTANILLMEPELTSCFISFSKDIAEAKKFLRQLKPGFGRADVNLANAVAARLIGPAAVRPEIYYISDFARKKWANADFTMLPPATKLFFVDAGPVRRDNHAILDARPAQTQMLAGDTVMLAVSVGNYSGEAFTGRITATLDKKFSVDQEISLSPWSEEKVFLPLAVGGPGLHLCEVRLPPDALAYDNLFYLTLSVMEKEEVLIVTDQPEDRRNSAYFLKTALNPFANDAGSLLPRVIPSSDLSPARLAGVRKMFFTQINHLGPEAADAAAKFLFRGGGLVYFLDGPADAENLAELEKIIGAGSMPMRLSRRNRATNILAGARQIARGDFKSPYLKLFQGDARQDLALLDFYDYDQAGATGAGGVLLEYGDGSPAMAALHHGLGTLLLLNFSAGEFSSNLARQRVFPAWMQDLVKTLSTSEPPACAHTFGETLQTEIWRAEMREDLRGPAGAAVNTKRELSGERCSVAFTPAELGFYTLGSPRPSYAFAINAATDQSDLRPIDKSILPAEFAEKHEAHLVAGGDDFDELARGRPIFQRFVFAALAVLLLESGFQYFHPKEGGVNSGGGIIFDPVLPKALIAVLGSLWLLFTVRVYWKVGSSIGLWRNGALILLRLAGLALVLALLLQPSRREFLPPPLRDRVTLIGVDDSLSMKQRDAGDESRFDAARNLLLESGAVRPDGEPSDPHLRLFTFSGEARPLRRSLFELAPVGKTTLFHKSIGAMLSAPANDEAVNAVILLTDGHDFELANPVKTGLLARERRASIYAVAFGGRGHARDVAVRITGFQPYCYVKQKALLRATLRLVGCELEDLTVQLLRQGQVTQTKRVNAQQLQELPVEFEVTEPAVGQYEYEIRVLPLENEVDTANNSAITYLNVIDQQIRVLLLEGDPYWDTTFLQRSLMRNDKFDVDALIRYGRDRVRAIRKTPGGELHAPQTLDQFAAYDVIILGRSVDSLLVTPPGPSVGAVSLLDQYVSERGGTVIFSRGRAFDHADASQLQPVLWGDTAHERVRLDMTAEGRALSLFRALNQSAGGMDALPDLLDEKEPRSTQPLTSTLAVAEDRDGATPEAAIVHRRYGQGQVVSIGVDGLWRWALNSKVEGANSPFDYFWDQMVLWLLAGRDFMPSRQFSFRPNSANILLGEKVYFRLVLRRPDATLKSVPVTIFFGGQEAGRANLTPAPSSLSRLTAEFLPERVGRYRAVAHLPDGTTQESRFLVFTENLEETEVATDGLYLRRLCESSGGRLLAPRDLGKLLKELGGQKTDQTPRTIVRPVWDVAWLFYLAGVLFGLDWFLRRRWGLC